MSATVRRATLTATISSLGARLASAAPFTVSRPASRSDWLGPRAAVCDWPVKGVAGEGALELKKRNVKTAREKVA